MDKKEFESRTKNDYCNYKFQKHCKSQLRSTLQWASDTCKHKSTACSWITTSRYFLSMTRHSRKLIWCTLWYNYRIYFARIVVVCPNSCLATQSKVTAGSPSSQFLFVEERVRNLLIVVTTIVVLFGFVIDVSFDWDHRGRDLLLNFGQSLQSFFSTRLLDQKKTLTTNPLLSLIERSLWIW